MYSYLYDYLWTYVRMFYQHLYKHFMSPLYITTLGEGPLKPMGNIRFLNKDPMLDTYRKVLTTFIFSKQYKFNEINEKVISSIIYVILNDKKD
jgi:hypothetical protein